MPPILPSLPELPLLEPPSPEPSLREALLPEPPLLSELPPSGAGAIADTTVFGAAAVAGAATFQAAVTSGIFGIGIGCRGIQRSACTIPLEVGSSPERLVPVYQHHVKVLKYL